MNQRTARMAALEAKVREIDVLKRQVARLSKVLALHRQPQQFATVSNR